MSAEINVAFIGYGLGGRVFHTPLVNAVKSMRVHSIMSRSEEKQRQAAEDWGCKVVGRIEDVLEDEAVDLVVISTPHSTHRDLVIQALEAGKHVVVDKVMATSLAEADEMIFAAKKAGKLLNVFQNRRWDGDFLTIRKALQEGLLGDPYICESRIVRWGQPRFTWRQSRAMGGGIFCDWGAHVIDQFLLLFGPVESVWADFLYTSEFDVETAAICHIRHASGVRSVFECGSISRIGRPRWYVRGSRGTLQKMGLDPQEPRLAQGLVEGVTPRTGEYEPRENWAQVVTEIGGLEMEMTLKTVPGRYVTYYENIADILLNGAEPLVKLGEVRAELAVLDAARQSAATGEVVRL
ncbi:MAG: Gfo/Idh/MocA family oxidoreductase [Candidatus Zipacnadales bacterium]